MGEGGIAIEVAVGSLDGLDVGIGVYHLGGKDATGEVAAVGDEVDGSLEMALCLGEALAYLGDMLVAERLVYTQVVVAPGEVGGGCGLLAGTGRAGDGIDAHIAGDETQLGGR